MYYAGYQCTYSCIDFVWYNGSYDGVWEVQLHTGSICESDTGIICGCYTGIACGGCTICGGYIEQISCTDIHSTYGTHKGPICGTYVGSMCGIDTGTTYASDTGPICGSYKGEMCVIYCEAI